MLTAAISAAIVAALAFFGISLSAVQIAGVVIVVKIFVVATIALLGLRLTRRRRAAAQASAAADPTLGESARQK